MSEKQKLIDLLFKAAEDSKFREAFLKDPIAQAAENGVKLKLTKGGPDAKLIDADHWVAGPIRMIINFNGFGIGMTPDGKIVIIPPRPPVRVYTMG